MSGKFTHYLITRFNVPVKNWGQDKAGKPILDESWMLDRISLFNNFCVPTLEAQTQKDFKWLIYCDRQTSRLHLEAIQKQIANIPMAEIRLSDDFDHLMADLRLLISGISTPYVITSRMDNDDGLGIHFIRQVQHHFTPEPNTLILLHGGILYDPDRHIVTEVKTPYLNHFGSLIEKASPVGINITVIGYPHDAPPSDIKVINIPGRYAWLKIIHERNLKSKMSGIPIFVKNLESYFGLLKNTFRPHLLNTGIYILHRAWAVMRRQMMFQRKS